MSSDNFCSVAVPEATFCECFVWIQMHPFMIVGGFRCHVTRWVGLKESLEESPTQYALLFTYDVLFFFDVFPDDPTNTLSLSKDVFRPNFQHEWHLHTLTNWGHSFQVFSLIFNTLSSSNQLSGVTKSFPGIVQSFCYSAVISDNYWYNMRFEPATGYYSYKPRIIWPIQTQTYSFTLTQIIIEIIIWVRKFLHDIKSSHLMSIFIIVIMGEHIHKKILILQVIKI